MASYSSPSSGGYAFHEIAAAVADAYADPAAPARAALLIDGRASLVDLSPEEIQVRTAWYRDLFQHGITSRCAMVVRASEYRQQIVAQGMAPLQETGFPVRSFARVAEAVAWLRAPPKQGCEERSSSSHPKGSPTWLRDAAEKYDAVRRQCPWLTSDNAIAAKMAEGEPQLRRAKRIIIAVNGELEPEWAKVPVSVRTLRDYCRQRRLGQP